MSQIKELRDKIKDLQVLFVDDEEEIREGTGTFLKKFFQNVAICKNGQEGLDYFKNNSVDIILSDVIMPKMDGVTMVKEIKKIKPNIFTVFITAYREPMEEEFTVDMYIKKPLSYEDMIMILNTIAEKYGK